MTQEIDCSETIRRSLDKTEMIATLFMLSGISGIVIGIVMVVNEIVR